MMVFMFRSRSVLGVAAAPPFLPLKISRKPRENDLTMTGMDLMMPRTPAMKMAPMPMLRT